MREDLTRAPRELGGDDARDRGGDDALDLAWDGAQWLLSVLTHYPAMQW